MNHTGEMRVTVNQAEKCIQQVQYVAGVVVAVLSIFDKILTQVNFKVGHKMKRLNCFDTNLIEK